MPADSIGNTLATAKPIFPIVSTQTSTEFIGVNAGTLDANDYYSFKLTRTSSFTLSLTGLSANADVEVLTSAGAIATGTDGSPLSSSNTGTLAESINNILDPGTYYIRVSPGPATDPLNPLTTTPSTNYSLNFAADSNTKTDILWRNYATGENATWVMNGPSLVSSVYLQSAADFNWKIQTTGDFNGDGNTDIVWRNYATGQNAFWLMNGTTLLSSSYFNTVADLNWQIQGAGDFNGDGNTDLVWRNYATGENAVWFIKNLTLSSSTYIESLLPLSARIEAVADFNLDGNPDILWRNYSATATNNNFIWLMNGTTKAGGAILPTATDLTWHIQGTADLNNDGNSDILWRNYANGTNAVWFLKGTTYNSQASLPTAADLNWRATAPFNRSLPAVRADAAGNTTTTAFSIGPINGNGIYRDTVSDTTDANDYYQFSLGSATQISLALTGLGGGALNGNLDLQLYNAFGGVVASSANGGNAAESLTVNGLVAGTYYLQVAAISGSSAYELNINANNLPVLLSNNTLTVSEGSALTISNTLLQVTDENNAANQLTYTLVTPPNIAKGALSLNGAAIAANSIFTQADINAGLLSYSQNGGETLTDSFVFNVADGVGGNIGNTTFTINTIPVNDPPTLSINTALTLNEGAVASLSSLNLLVTDVEQTATQLIYSLNSLPANGSLRLNNTAIAAGSTFTQADVSSGTKLSYSHNGTEAANDSFSFTVTDGAGGTVLNSPQTFNIAVTPVNDAPVLISNKGLTVTEGAAPIITSALLQTSDAEFTGPAISPQLPDRIIYTVGTLPINGTLFVGTNALTVNGTFTQADVNNNRILYNHNGSKTNSDSFVFHVSDGTTVTTDSTFNIIVSSVNSPPVLSLNAGLQVNEGATANIGSTLLQVTDPDNPAPQVIYTLGQKPVSGSLKLNGTALTVGQTFSQQDINNLPNSRLTYQHDGSETTSDSFSFTASDPFGAAIPSTTFSIGVTPVNDAPILLSNTGLTLSEGAASSITTALLNATDVDNLDPQIIYTVSTPAHGSLVLGATTVTSFTQAELASGQLRYVHDGSEAISDSFTFTLGDGVTTTAARTFNVSVIPVNDAPGIVNNLGLTLAEGGTSTIANAALLITDSDGPSSPTYTLGTGTTKGALKLGTATLVAGQTFTQADITNNRLSYSHDGSESTADSFTFTASDGSTGTLALTTFNIAVTPVNDVPVLVSNSSITLLEGALTTISSSVLQVSDGDGPPLASLVYNVTTAPNNGTLRLSGNPVTSFTQANLNSGQLVYQHNGGESLTDSFAFTVTDGVVTTPVGPNVFNIAVTPVNDAPGVANNLGLTLAEGGTSTIASAALSITDNDGPGPLTYTLSAGATKGTLKLGSTALAAGQTFTQADIANNSLSYTHDGSETTADSFSFTASDSSTGTIALTNFNIAVTPVNDAPVLVSNSSVTLLEGALTTISSSVLQVSDGDGPPLSSLVYNVTTGPTNGTLLLAGNSVTSFTQANLNSGQLVYQHNGNESLADSFAFTVTDGVVTTPVSSVFNIAVTPVNDAPGIANNLGLTLAEGGTSTIASAALSITDNDGPGPLTYTLSAGTTKGTLKLGTATLLAGQTFTQADIANSSLSYTHDGSETTADSFSFTAADGSTGTIALTTFNIAVTPVNDAPVLTVPGFQVIDEDLPLAFTGSKLISVSDADVGGNPLVVTLGAAGGTLSLNPGSLTVNNNGTGLVTLTGQLTAINTALSSLIYKGSANFNGPDTITVAVTDQGSTGAGGAKTDARTIDLLVNPINDAPTLTVPGAQTVLEDTALSLATLIDTTDVDSGSNPVKVNLGTLNGKLTLGTTGGLTFADNTTNGDGSLSFTGTIASVRAALATLSYQGSADYFGPDTITIKVDDQGAVGSSGALNIQKTIAVNVTPVNDVPVFTPGTNLVVNEDAAQQTVNWATGIATGPANEASQTLNFVTSNNNAGLFTIAPTIDPSGKLTYTLAPNANGVATVTVNLKDSGGTANGGNDTSPASIFTITANPVNDAPSFTKGANQTIAEDAGAQTVAGWATAIKTGPADEAAQTLSVLVNTDNPSLFSVAPTIDPTTGTLTYTAAPNANGTAIVTVQLKDNGGTDLGGVDTSTLQTFTINVTAVNDAPLFTLPNPPTVGEDTTLPLTGISLADVDSGSSSLVVTLAVGSGTLQLGNTAGLTITAGANNSSSVAFRGNLNDINAALAGLSYRGNLNFNGADTLTLTANDQGNTGSGAIGIDNKTLGITVTAVNDAPVITVPSNQTVDEDTNLLLSGISLNDVDANPSSITVTLSATNGTLTLDPLVAGSATLTLTDTVANINTAIANVIYKGNLNYNGADTITIQANDQGNTGFGGALSDIKTISVNVNAVNDVPILTVPGAQIVNEDTNLVFNAGKLISLTDVDSGLNPIQVGFTVSNGTLTLGAVGGENALTGSGTGTVTYTGTVAGLTSVLNTLTYRGKQDYFGADTLNITVNDQGNTGSGSPGIVTGAVAITVSSVNDAPVLVTNRTLTLSEGTSGVITNSQLRTTDVDNTPDLLVYTLFSAPNPLTSGSLRLTNSGGTTATLAAGGTFTQADVNSGYLSYLQNGSETTSDSFTFKVADNTPGSITIPGSGNATFNIAINPVNDAPTIVNNARLNLTEGTTSNISSTLLSVSDADNTTVQLKYTLGGAPSNGNLRLNGTALTLNQTFTQDDINSNRLSYRHSGSETTSDSFIFTVNDGAGGTTGTRTFNIGVTNVNDAPTIVSAGPATVNEGATLNITNALLKTSDPDNLSSELIYTLPTVPVAGTLFLNGVALAANATVTQQQIDQGSLTYVHNGSEPNGNDIFVFRVSDGTTTLSDRVFNFNINPVNDAPVLVSNNRLILAGSTPSLTVIGSDLLQVTDVDNTSAQLTYTVTAVPNPTVGILRLNGTQITAGGTFTQADIDSNSISFDYFGNGSSEVFQFTVADGGVDGTLSNAYFYINFSY